jgi:hypothetical protein
MMINGKTFGLIPEDITVEEAKERIKEIDSKIANPPATLLPAAIPVLELERKELEAFIAMTPQARYDSKRTRTISLKLNKGTGADILKKLEEVGNVQGYIKSLIRADITR